MAKKKQSNNGSSAGITLLAVLLCILLIGYQPIKDKLNLNPSLEEKIENVVVEKNKEKIEQKVVETKKQPEKKNNSSVSTFPKPSTGIEVPARSKKISELILKRKNYTVSYNKNTKQPNWVAWELNKEKLEERESRTNKFFPDPDLKVSEAVTTDDYKGSGYDRGHMCPAGDSRWHWKAMIESFYMSNVCPQNHKLNNGDWNELEIACRKWARQKEKIYIVCGPIFYKNAVPEYIGKKQKIRVPEAFFKVVLSMNPPQAIGFIYKNQPTNKKLSSYVNSIDQVERITGFDFFPALPDEIERKVEAKYDLNHWKK